jgi:hypothetical protein
MVDVFLSFQRSLLQQRQDYNVLGEFDGVPIEPIHPISANGSSVVAVKTELPESGKYAEKDTTTFLGS